MNNKILIYFILIFLLFIKNKSYENFTTTFEQEKKLNAINKNIKNIVNKNVKNSFNKVGAHNMASFPVGTILAFYQTDNANLPTGWFECNGQNLTPDLRGRFLFGKGYTNNTLHNNLLNHHNRRGEKDEDGVSITKYDHIKLKVENLPKHNHSGTFNNEGAHSHGGVTELDGMNGAALAYDKNGDRFYVEKDSTSKTTKTAHQHEFKTNNETIYRTGYCELSKKQKLF